MRRGRLTWRPLCWRPALPRPSCRHRLAVPSPAGSHCTFAVANVPNKNRRNEMALVSRRWLIAAFAAMLLAGCGKPEPPPPPPKPPAPPPPAANEEMKRLAAEIYVYAFPLVLMDVTKQVSTSKGPINTFQHRRAFAEATSTDIVRPNVDTLLSQAWLDLTREPIV